MPYNPCKQAALDYAARGWSVIPLWSSEAREDETWLAERIANGAAGGPGKTPPPGFDVKKFHARIAFPEEIEAWFARWPDANIGILTGGLSELVVVDLDPAKGDAPPLPASTITVTTGSGGSHHYYAHPGERVPNQAGQHGPGIDVRGDGGYVVAPPSVHPRTGQPYTWASFDGDAPLCVAPPWALKPDARVNTKAGSEPQEKWLADLLTSGAPIGGRNDALVRLAGYYAGKGIPRDVGMHLCQQWNAALECPLPDDEVEHTVGSAYKMARESAPPQVITEKQADELLELTPFDHFMARHADYKTDWLIKDWLPDRTIAFLVSPPQSYKTYMLVDLALSIASGGKFLGQYPVLDAGPVVIFQQEDNLGKLAERLAVIDSVKRPWVVRPEPDGVTLHAPPDLPIYLHEKRQLRLDSAQPMQALEQICKRLRPKAVFIDPLYSAVDTDEYMAKAAKKLLSLKSLRDEYGTSFIILHHAGKSSGREGGDPWDRQSLWGSQFINAFVETSWIMRKPPGVNAAIVHRHTKDDEEPPFIRAHFKISREAPIAYQVTCEEIDRDDACKALQSTAVQVDDGDLQAKIESRLGGGPSTITDLAKELKLPKRMLKRALQAMLQHGILAEENDEWSLV